MWCSSSSSSSCHYSSTTPPVHRLGQMAASRKHANAEDEEEAIDPEEEEMEDPLVQAVERAVEDALEMLLRDDDDDGDDNKNDDKADDGNASDQDSITSTCRAKAEQSLRDELALADSGFLASYYYQARSFKENNWISRRFEDNQDQEGWWLDIKQQDSVAGTSITEASSSWSTWSNSGDGRTTDTANDLFDRSFEHDCLPPEQYWEHLLVRISHETVLGPPPQQQRIDLVVACNLLAVAWEAKCRRGPPTILWRGWKQQLDERLNADVWTRLLGRSDDDDDTHHHVAVLAVPLLGGAVRHAKTSRCSFGFLGDTWNRYLTNSHDYYEIQEID
jgi:hypothetical protein